MINTSSAKNRANGAHNSPPKQKKQQRRTNSPKPDGFDDDYSVISSGSDNNLDPTEHTSSENVNSAVFQKSVRNDWVDAVFGSNFFPHVTLDANVTANGTTTATGKVGTQEKLKYVAPTRGKGLSEIESYVAYTASIPSDKAKPEDKIGVTLTRLPLGVYARTVDTAGQAHASGVLPGSVLIAINDLNVLADPSPKLLERLWQYEGHFGDSTVGTVALKLLKDGRVYTAIFLAPPPFGISWAPCGNFALVQKSYSFAQAAGIRRGCIIAGVNDRSFRDMDHRETARELRLMYESKKVITMTLAYTPAASRSTHVNNSIAPLSNCVDSQIGGTTAKQTKKKRSSVGSFLKNSLACGSVNSGSLLVRSRDQVSELAELVAAAELEAPIYGSKHRQQNSTLSSNTYSSNQKSDGAPTALKKVPSTAALKFEFNDQDGNMKYGRCPDLPVGAVSEQWNSMDAMMYCLSFYRASFSEEAFRVIPLSVISSISGPTRGKPSLTSAVTSSNSTSREKYISALRTSSVGDISYFHLMIVSILCAAEHSAGAGEDSTVRFDEIEIIIDLAMKSDELCFRMYWLLQSFLEVGEKSAKYPVCVLRNTQRYLCSRMAEFKYEYPEEMVDEKSVHIVPDSVETVLNEEFNLSFNGALEMEEDVLIEDTQKFATDTSTFQPSNMKSSVKKSKRGRIRSLFKTKQKDNSNRKSDKNHSYTAYDESIEDRHIDQQEKYVENVDNVIFEQPHSEVHLSLNNKILQPPSILRTAKPQHLDIDNISLDFKPSSMCSLVDSTAWLLNKVGVLCEDAEAALIKTLSQKVADMTYYPWTATKETALFNATKRFREGLRNANEDGKLNQIFPLINPIDPSELLASFDPDESFILPSAQFPLLLCFNISEKNRPVIGSPLNSPTQLEDGNSSEMLYRTKIEVSALRGLSASSGTMPGEEQLFYTVQGTVAGLVQETKRSTLGPYFNENVTHRWYQGNSLVFDVRSSWGAPKTLALRLFSTSAIGERKEKGLQNNDKGMNEVGDSWINLNSLWGDQGIGDFSSTKSGSCVTFQTKIWTCNSGSRSNVKDPEPIEGSIELELKVTTEIVKIHGDDGAGVSHPALHGNIYRKRMLLFKHVEDLRQEMLAIQFIETCDRLLKASGLDLKIRTFRCLAVGGNRGILQWVQGSVSLSKICRAKNQASTYDSGLFAVASAPVTGAVNMAHSIGRHIGSNVSLVSNNCEGNSPLRQSSKTNIDANGIDSLSLKKEPPNSDLRRPRGWCKYQTLRKIKSSCFNPIQEFLRNAAYDPTEPYFIAKGVMDTFVKSCAGYCVVTYLLGVGDRHLDNILLHPNGYLFHCDYSYILGRDPKMYIPVRVTEDMILAMGGRDSDNYTKFLSLTGAAFVSLRRHNNMRVLVSLIRVLSHASLPDISVKQNADNALLSLCQRFRMDLCDDDAISYMEKLIESCLENKLWIAVDTFHSIGKR
eukprot:CAMPEP_0194375564 /NCGR_PEP_ID=MMETSP0174-20130528/24101_1 /TAXON_ID=216777 /ORGANISM="Proboscia alata, Strain PI-D3" /LENGTH=1458 /DNA_ID=CAMNT_0039155847 /DNA_START=85 /DNA_END=4458 /DNA_ORIENTATION=+